MKAKIYGFRFLIALSAFVFGIGAYSMRQLFQSPNQPQKPQTLAVSPKTELFNFTDFNKTVVQIDKVTEKQSEPEFYVDGEYHLIGKAPKEFEDFEYLDITTDTYDEKSDQVKAIPPEGFIFSKKQFKFTHIKINDKKISLVTENRQGISYQFTGTFFGYKETKIYFDEDVYLEGRLIKMRDGKKIAEINVKFTVYSDC